MKKNHHAFTLAEILITLSIVGIISAMTIPTLITKYKRKELQTRFNKTYAVVNQALKLTMLDLGLDESSDFKIYYDKDKNKLKQNFTEINKVWESKFRGATKLNKLNKSYPQYDFWGNTWPYGYFYNYNTKNTFLLPSGAQISDLDYDGNVSYQSSIALVIFFDTNGPEKGPNRAGYDLFYYYNDGKIHNYYLAPSCTPLAKPINPYWQGIQYSTCSIYAMQNINPYDNSKKYWDSIYRSKSWWEDLANKSK